MIIIDITTWRKKNNILIKKLNQWEICYLSVYLSYIYIYIKNKYKMKNSWVLIRLAGCTLKTNISSLWLLLYHILLVYQTFIRLSITYHNNNDSYILLYCHHRCGWCCVAVSVYHIHIENCLHSSFVRERWKMMIMIMMMEWNGHNGSISIADWKSLMWVSRTNEK